MKFLLDSQEWFVFPHKLPLIMLLSWGDTLKSRYFLLHGISVFNSDVRNYCFWRSPSNVLQVNEGYDRPSRLIPSFLTSRSLSSFFIFFLYWICSYILMAESCRVSPQTGLYHFGTVTGSLAIFSGWKTLLFSWAVKFVYNNTHWPSSELTPMLKITAGLTCQT